MHLFSIFIFTWVFLNMFMPPDSLPVLPSIFICFLLTISRNNNPTIDLLSPFFIQCPSQFQSLRLHLHLLLEVSNKSVTWYGFYILELITWYQNLYWYWKPAPIKSFQKTFSGTDKQFSPLYTIYVLVSKLRGYYVVKKDPFYHINKDGQLAYFLYDIEML